MSAEQLTLASLIADYESLTEWNGWDFDCPPADYVHNCRVLDELYAARDLRETPSATPAFIWPVSASSSSSTAAVAPLLLTARSSRAEMRQVRTYDELKRHCIAFRHDARSDWARFHSCFKKHVTRCHPDLAGREDRLSEAWPRCRVLCREQFHI